MSNFRRQHMSIAWDSLVKDSTDTPAKNAPLSEKSALVGRVGLMMLSVGAGAFRVRAAMNKVSRALGITCAADIALLSIEYTCVEKTETYTNALSIRTTGVNTSRLYQLRHFSDEFFSYANTYSVKHFFAILDKIEESKPQYSALLLALAAAVACASFTFLLGGGPIEMLCAFFGAGIGNFVRKKLIEKHVTLYANVSLAVAAACLVYIALVKAAEMAFAIPNAHQAGYICAMLFVIPGFPLITGGIDLAKLDLRSGCERILYALLIVFIATVTGWLCAFCFHFSPSDFMTLPLSPLMRVLFRLCTSFFAVYGFSLMFNSTPRMAFVAALIGMIVNTVRLEILDRTTMPMYLAAWLAALCAGLLASASKTRTGFPRLTVTVPSVVIMVPGLFMYRGVYFLAQEAFSTGALYLLKALMVVCSLCLGLIFARIFTDKNFRTST